MEKYKIEANEKFFTNIMSLLHDGGKYGWIDQNEEFTKKDGKLFCDEKGYKAAKAIVSDEFFSKTFRLNEK